MSYIDSHPKRRAFVANTLHRLVDLISEQGEVMLQSAGIEFPSRAASTVLLLGDHGPMSAADIAKELGQPHQLVTQRLDLLIGTKIVARVGDVGDARRKVLSLTAKGRKQLQLLNRCLRQADTAFDELFAEIACDLSSAARRALDALGRSSISARVRSLKRAAV